VANIVRFSDVEHCLMMWPLFYCAGLLIFIREL